MFESDFENVLSRYPELIEDGIKYIDRQVYIDGKYIDLVFKDRFNEKLIVELKRGAIKRKDIAQLLDYEGYFVSLDNPNTRIMLIGNKVPMNLQRSLDHHGIEWKEIPIHKIIEHLKDNNDSELLLAFKDEISSVREVKDIEKSRSKSTHRSSGNIRIIVLDGIVNKFDMFRSSEEIFAVARGREEACIKKNLTFWSAICNSLWFLSRKKKGLIGNNVILPVPEGKYNLRIELVTMLANNIDEYRSPEDMFAVPASRKEQGIKQNLTFWKAICDSLWLVYH